MKKLSYLFFTVAMCVAFQGCHKETFDVTKTPWHCGTSTQFEVQNPQDYNYPNYTKDGSTETDTATATVNACENENSRDQTCVTDLACNNQLTNASCYGTACLNGQ